MNRTPERPQPLDDRRGDLEAVLGAWHAATVRLEQTHEALREEVRRLTDELEIKNRELARKNRLADLGQMAAHVAHEVRNNLVPVNLYLGLLRRRIADDAESLGILDRVAAGFESLDVMVGDLLQFTADREPQLQSFPLSQLVEDVLGSLRPQMAAQAIRPANRVPGPLVLQADWHMLRRALMNLAINALDAMPGGGALTIDAEDGPAGIELRVGDTGSGLSEEALCRVFDPFFTTKHNGTGLGLAIVARVAAAHGGEVSAGNSPQHGAVFTLKIPHLVREAAA